MKMVSLWAVPRAVLKAALMVLSMVGMWVVELVLLKAFWMVEKME